MEMQLCWPHPWPLSRGLNQLLPTAMAWDWPWAMNCSCTALRGQGPPRLYLPVLTAILALEGMTQPEAEPDVKAWAQLDPLPSSCCKTATGGSFINAEADMVSAAQCVQAGRLGGEEGVGRERWN